MNLGLWPNLISKLVKALDAVPETGGHHEGGREESIVPGWGVSGGRFRKGFIDKIMLEKAFQRQEEPRR